MSFGTKAGSGVGSTRVPNAGRGGVMVAGCSLSRSYDYDVAELGRIRVAMGAEGDDWDLLPVLDSGCDFAVTRYGYEVLRGTFLSTTSFDALRSVLAEGCGSWELVVDEGEALVLSKAGAVVVLASVRGSSEAVVGIVPSECATEASFAEARSTLAFEAAGQPCRG